MYWSLCSSLMAAGSFCRLASAFILSYQIHKKQSCQGVSLKTQALYAVVFLTRYLDLFFAYISPFNTVMKILFIASSCYIIYLMKIKFKSSQDASNDSLPIDKIIAPCTALALLFNYRMTVTEVLWSFSRFLDMLAILPQFVMLQRTGDASGAITSYYVLAFGAYRMLYHCHWYYRYFGLGILDPISVIPGHIQTVLYVVFAYFYFTKRTIQPDAEKQSELPVHNNEELPVYNDEKLPVYGDEKLPVYSDEKSLATDSYPIEKEI